MLTLVSGARIVFDEQWCVVSESGVVAIVAQRPNAALLLLEMEPSAETFDALPGFPFGEVIERGKRSGLLRYQAGAKRWAEALRARE